MHVAISCRPTRKYTIDIAAKQAAAAAVPSVVEKAALLRTKSIRYTRRLGIFGPPRSRHREKGGERFCKLCKKRGAGERGGGGGRSLQKGVSASAAAATNPTVRPSVLKRVRSPLSVLCANRSEKGGRSSVQKLALLFSPSPPRAPVLGLGIGTTFRKESSRA